MLYRFLLVPASALLLSWAVLAEVPTVATMGGGIVAGSAVALVNRARARAMA